MIITKKTETVVASAAEALPTKYAEARRLLARGFKLCELHPLSKRPVGNGWQLNPISAVLNTAGGYGMPLAINDLCSIDPDSLELARIGLKRCGFDLEELMNEGVRTTSTRPGSGGRSTFKAPPDLLRVVFSSKTSGTILELRAGNSNLQDCLPGTEYAGKDGEIYLQDYASERRMDDAPELRPALLAWWRRMNSDIKFKREQQALLCRKDAVLAVSTEAAGGTGSKLAFASPYRREFNAATPVEDILARHGYSTDGGGRWAPSTATGTPCVRLIPGCEDLWQSDHASDPLLGTFDGWTASVVLDHGGDVDRANTAWQPYRDAAVALEFEDLREGARSALEARVQHLAEMEALAGVPDLEYENLPALIKEAELPAGQVAEMLARISAAAGRDVAQVMPAPRFTPVPAHEFVNRCPPPPDIIEGVLPTAELVMGFGESGAGKSFIFLDMACSVARGIPWRGKRVTAGRVVYIAAEGAGGFGKRLQAYAQHHEVDLANVDLSVIWDCPDLFGQDDKPLARAIEAAGGAQLIVVDTLAQVTAGANENSGEDMGKVLSHCKRLHRATGATVLLIHHAGKDTTKGARGWSGVRAAVDAELEVTRDKDVRSIRITKQKDGEDGGAFGFALKTVDLVCKYTGRSLTSCVAIEASPVSAAPKLNGKWQAAVHRAVHDRLLAATDEVDVSEVIAAAVLEMPAVGGKRDRRDYMAERALKELSAAGVLSLSRDGMTVGLSGGMQEFAGE